MNNDDDDDLTKKEEWQWPGLTMIMTTTAWMTNNRRTDQIDDPLLFTLLCIVVFCWWYDDDLVCVVMMVVMMMVVVPGIVDVDWCDIYLLYYVMMMICCDVGVGVMWCDDDEMVLCYCCCYWCWRGWMNEGRRTERAGRQAGICNNMYVGEVKEGRARRIWMSGRACMWAGMAGMARTGGERIMNERAGM